MSYQNYNYYGVYDEDSRKFSYSVQDIYKIQKEKDKQRMKIYERILSKCFKKIKELSLHEENYCFFEMPEYIPGSPLYNMTECVIFMVNSLQDKGFKARYVDPFMIFITWTIPKPELRRKEPLMIQNSSNLTNSQNYYNQPLSINNYPSPNLTPRLNYQQSNYNNNNYNQTPKTITFGSQQNQPQKPTVNTSPSGNFFFKR